MPCSAGEVAIEVIDYFVQVKPRIKDLGFKLVVFT